MASAVEALNIFILFYRDTILDFAKKVFPLPEPKLLVVWMRIVKRCKLRVKCCTLFSTNTVVLALESVQHIMVTALEPFSAHL
jgi:hypothetical protein